MSIEGGAYSVDRKEFVEQNILFMRGLRDRVQQNVTLDSKHEEFYKKVLSGIDVSIGLAEMLKGHLE